MSKIRLIYFKGCPKYAEAKAALDSIKGIDVEEVCQDNLQDDHKYKYYSSPTIIKGDEVIVGGQIQGAGGCTAESISANDIKVKLSKSKVESKSWMTKLGTLGSVLVIGLCPICIPAVGAFLISIGLGFLVSESVLKPMLFVFLGLVLAGLTWSYLKEHRNPLPLVVGIIMSIVLYLGRYVYFSLLVNKLMMYGGIAGLVAITFWNLHLRKSYGCKVCVTDTGEGKEVSK